MIRTIKMKNCATYPSVGALIENCQKVNFFYGPNGSGKSTISNFLQSPTDSQYRECEIGWENDTAVDVVVYNRKFRVKNFKENIAGVFTLGQTTIEDIQALENMKEQRTQKYEDYTTRGNTLKKKIQDEIDHKAAFRDTVWERILKPNETEFQEAFSGFRNNKERFRDEVLRRFQLAHSSSESRDNLLARANNISTIKAYERNNPIKTSYELLWQELKSNTNASLVTTQNIMRRILGNYFSILGKTKDDTIVDSFSTIEEKMICRSLLSWINDGSHTIPDDLYIDSYTDSVDRYKQIFREVFVKMGHEAHYKMMMGEV